jgi:GxxExxY protein
LLKKSKGGPIKPIPANVERISRLVLDNVYKVHSTLGPGLLESVYESCLAYELRQSGILVETQVAFPITYKDMQVESGLRLDMLVGKCVIAEIKSVENWNLLYEAQLLTYLRITGVRLGYLINFNVLHLKNGIKRRVV